MAAPLFVASSESCALTARPALRSENAPYTGIQDGLVPALRREFPADVYDGVEIEMNQRAFLSGQPKRRAFRRAILASTVELWRACSGRR